MGLLLRRRNHKAQEHDTIALQHNPSPDQNFLLEKVRKYDKKDSYLNLREGTETTKSHITTERTVQKIADGASLNDTRARPKSQIFNLQSALARIFFGFRSR